MERLTKKQREILNSACKVFPNSISSSDIPPKAFNVSDIKILESKGLVNVDYTAGSYSPVCLTITPNGIEKLQENFKTRLIDAVHDNPLAVIAIIISVLSIFATIYTNVHTNQRTESLSIDLNEVKGKLAEYDTLVVKNFTSTSNTVSFLCPNGTVPWGEIVNDSGHFFVCAPK
jgi:hypothetical protein